MEPACDTDNPAAASPSGVRFGDPEADQALSAHLAELSDPEAFGWQKVKTNASRTVYRGQVDGREVFLKHYHSRSLLYQLRRKLGFGDSLHEMDFSQYLQAHGVPTPKAVAAMCRPGLEWYASEAVSPAEPADAWHMERLSDGPAGRAAIRAATVELAQLIGRMHKAGAIHHDLHCGNILVRTEGQAIRLVLTDLHRASRKKHMGRRAMSANLAQLYYDRTDFTSRTDRLRFLRHYLAATGAPGSVRGWMWMIECFAAIHRRRQHHQRDRRIFGRNRYFAPITLANWWRGHVVLRSKRQMAGSAAAGLRFDLRQWSEALAEPDKLFAGPDVQVLKESPSGLVIRRKLRLGPHEINVVIKRPRRKRRRKTLADCFRRARTIRAFALGHKLLTRRVATALPLAALERRVGPFLLDSVLITEDVQAPRLNEFVNTWLASPPNKDNHLTVPQQRHLAQEVLGQLGQLVRRLHDNRFAHRDLKANNILVRWFAGRTPRLVLLDLDGLRKVTALTARRRLQGLMRLNVSLLKCPAVNHAGRLRMLLGYLRRPGLGRIDFKQFWRVLEAWSAKKLRQQIRSRRRRQKLARRPDR